MEAVVFIEEANIQEIAPLLRGVACSNREIIFGDDGLNESVACGVPIDPDSWTDGRFFAVVDVGEKVRVFTDPLGQDTLYIYSREPVRVGGPPLKNWVISNSFFELASLINHRGCRLTFAPGVVAAGLVDRGTRFGAQLISNRTPLQEISVLPLGCAVEYCKITGQATVVRNCPGDWLVRGDSCLYADRVEAFIHNSVARIRALADSGFYMSLDLSGGQDSRTIFGLVLRSGIDFSKVEFFSNPRRLEDLECAMMVSREYGLSLSRSRASVKSSRGGYDLWKASALGVYLPIYARGTPDCHSSVLQFHGASILSKKFSKKNPVELADYMYRCMPTKEMGSEVREIFIESFRSIGVNLNDEWASHLHYINFRSRFHYGRNWATSCALTLWTPLISQELGKAAFSLPLKEYRNLAPWRDVMMAVDNRLVEIPFDSPEKCFNREQIESSVFFRKEIGIPSSLPSVAVYGRPTFPSIRSDDDRPARVRLEEDLARLAEPALETGIFGPDVVKKAQKALKGSEPVSRSGRLAALVISAGTFASLATG